MKKTAALACFFLCLLPAWVKAEDPSSSTRRDYSLSRPAEEEALAAEARVNDEELVRIAGHGLETAIPMAVLPSAKLEMAASRIKLWDEADKGISNSGNCLQRVTLSTIGNK
ncbi:hypothetical protein [Geotalea sp. SG265]|uniref:hypothetical protein n=1 Tax=Geotalea sp. SG265 TaxID=2922867 RepID=UPI001FAFE137|nr:hypothetical protein [Geotalea sp. SG265]